MILIFKGDIATNTGKSHREQVRDDIGTMYESDAAIVGTKAGRFQVEDGVLGAKLGDEVFWISPLCGDLTMDDFPAHFSFGNEKTGPMSLHIIRSGVTEYRSLHFAVFPLGTTFTDEQLYRMQEIFEGIPPGTPS